MERINITHLSISHPATVSERDFLTPAYTSIKETLSRQETNEVQIYGDLAKHMKKERIAKASEILVSHLRCMMGRYIHLLEPSFIEGARG